jgi:hypothetical protein
MKRIRSHLRITVPLALLLGAAMATMMPSAPVFAENWKDIDSDVEPNGDITILSQDQDDKSHYYLWTYKADDTIIGHDFYSPGDEGPDGSTQRVEKPDVAGMLKKTKGLTIHISASPKEGTPLAGWLESEGRGGSIRWNPADDSDKGGPGQAPTGHTGGLTPKQLAAITKNINFIAKSLAAIGASMGDGVDGLASESAPTPSKGDSSARGKGTSDGKGDGGNKDKWRHGGEVVTLGPRPDLVNPAPKNKTGSSKLVTPKLLHTNKGFSHSGPTATGKWFRGGAPGANLR